MMKGPPAAPNATTGACRLKTIVGLMLLRGRFPGPGELGWEGLGSKSFSSLLRRKPCSGTTMPLPPIAPIVDVCETMLPSRSVTVTCVVEAPSPSVVGVWMPSVDPLCA